MSSDLLLHPVFDIPNEAAGVPNPEVVYPTSQDRIDQVYHPIHRLRGISTKHLLEFSQKGRPRFHPRRDPHCPLTSASFNPPEIKPKKAEGFVAGKIHHLSFVSVDLHIKLSELLKQPLIRRPYEPIPSPKTIHKDHQVSNAGELPPYVLSEPGVNLSAHRAPIIQPLVLRPSASAETARVAFGQFALTSIPHTDDDVSTS